MIRLALADVYDLGAEFFRWEFATALAGAFLGIQPFDQPNVQESKDNTRRLLAGYIASGELLEDLPEGVRGASRTRCAMTNSPRALCCVFFAQAEAGDYVALQAYVAPGHAGRGGGPPRPCACICVTTSAWRPRWATVRASCIRPASSTRAGRTRVCSCSSSDTTRWTWRSPDSPTASAS